MLRLQTENLLPRYLGLLYLVLFVMMARFWFLLELDGFQGWAFAVMATAAYAGLYLLPVLLIGLLALLLIPKAWPWRMAVVGVLLAIAGTAVMLAVYGDYQLYVLYEYHFNGFVWNLLTTPGGIAALGATAETERTVALIVVGLFVSNLGLVYLLHRYRERIPCLPSRKVLVVGLGLFGLLAGEELVYAYSIYTGSEPLIEAANVIPFHLRSEAKGLFGKLGVQRRFSQQLRLAGGQVDYPGALGEIKGKLNGKNVIVLVAESFRWDLLTPEITPNLWRFSQRAKRYENHYSGGNRTRMGLFSMFYGIYAPYWYSFEQQRVAPVLMNKIRESGYQLAIHTSQSFDYPELRHTVFTGVPESQLQEIKQGEPWERDIRNIDDLERKVDQRDPSKPFFGFMFFESTHAPYTFPEKSALRSDYARDMNYLALNLRENIEGIHARYINAAHHVDAQVGRFIEHLERKGMLDNTILLFTGDHGEEFMEKGHWGHGHNNSFPEEQVRVPLILWEPGAKPEVITHRTSHLQIPSTLLRELGIKDSSRNYSSADPLEVEMPYFIFGSYNYMGVFDGKNKITFPFTGRDYFHYGIVDAKDHPVTRTEREAVISEAGVLVESISRESRRFVR